MPPREQEQRDRRDRPADRERAKPWPEERRRTADDHRAEGVPARKRRVEGGDVEPSVVERRAAENLLRESFDRNRAEENERQPARQDGRL